MARQIRVLLPLLLVGAMLIAFPFLESLWKRYNPIMGAWQGEKITYYNGSEYQVSLQEAFRRWEETGLGIRFEETKDRSEADLLVFSGEAGLRERCTSDDCSGWATIGYTPFRQAEMWLLPPSNPYENKLQDFIMMPVLIHEVGHVLGLPHNREFCSIMNSQDPSCRVIARSRIGEDGRWMLCGPWERDLDDLRKLYPEVGTEFSGWCHDPRATWDFFARYGDQIVKGLRAFQTSFPSRH